MSFPLITFIYSGIAIIVFIALKWMQQKTDVLLFWPQARNRIEVKVQREAKKAEHFFNQFSKKHLYLLLYYFLTRIRRMFAWIQAKLDHRTHHVVNLIKGKQNIDTTKKASHFLHDVTRFKDRFKRK